MKYRLGIDLGTSSIGVAAFEWKNKYMDFRVIVLSRLINGEE